MIAILVLLMIVGGLWYFSGINSDDLPNDENEWD